MTPQLHLVAVLMGVQGRFISGTCNRFILKAEQERGDKTSEGLSVTPPPSPATSFPLTASPTPEVDAGMSIVSAGLFWVSIVLLLLLLLLMEFTPSPMWLWQLLLSAPFELDLVSLLS